MNLISYIQKDETFTELLSALTGEGELPASVYAPPVFQGYLIAAIKEAVWPYEVLLITAPDEAGAIRLAEDVAVFRGKTPVRLLPSRSAIWGSGFAHERHSIGLRHAALAAYESGTGAIIVAAVTALQERHLTPSGWPSPLTISRDGKTAFNDVIEKLASLGYERLPQVEDPGQFSVRGGIIDFFPSTNSAPLRLEYWGDELESLRRFSPFTQRSLADEQSFTVFAAQEPEPVITGRDGGLLDAGRRDLHVCMIDPEMGAQSVSSLWEDALEYFSLEKDAAEYYFTPEELKDRLKSISALSLSSLPAEQPFQFAATQANFGSRNYNEANRQLNRMVNEGLKVFVCFPTKGGAKRAEHGLAGQATVLAPDAQPPQSPGTWLTVCAQPAGFLSKDLGLAVLGERALLRPTRYARSQHQALRGRAVLSFRDLSAGDFVVHQDHGIGIFDAIETRTVAGINRDYLNLRFKGDDRLFVPQEQISKVSRYVGATAGSPPLNKLGGRAWSQARARARNAAREMAGELLQLYSVRQSLPGYAFGPDSEWQLELEAEFPYVETPDQAAAIDDVKDDMESARPMDRLICGDVGYGKTEVALRSAFKAASGGKQVLILAPTTILALQHFGTFRERFRKFPVNVEMISRFRSQSESRRIAKAFREGKIDVLIGTHRLLSADMVPKDLGLVIIDEEQRFGVVQKEALRQMRLKVDVLSLSATPIPRTLQMSLSGIRDISIMETPPPGRNPIRTYVGEYDEEMAGQAITREIGRGGQVFFLHNRVETIEEKAGELRGGFPQVKFLVAHGRMPEKDLESVMVSFLNREADVLVCTSIIESGLDIPTANTLIVDHAHLLGLSQLYQIRGRIGRSQETAHAYLFYPPAAILTPEALARLSTLGQYTELGSGFRIAMRDLEIRGARNLLGDEQSGHIAAVGFDMYCDLLKSAVAELQDKPVQELRIPRLDVDVDAYIPSGYIPLETARIDIHHRIAAARSEYELGEIKNELEDRFGPLPEVVYNLMDMQEIRLRAGVLGAALVVFRRGRLELTDITLNASERTALEEANLKFVYHPLRRTLTFWPGESAELTVVKKTLDAIIGRLFVQTANV